MSSRKRPIPWKNEFNNKLTYVQSWNEIHNEQFHPIENVKFKSTPNDNWLKSKRCKYDDISSSTKEILNPFDLRCTELSFRSLLSKTCSLPEINASKISLKRQNSEESFADTESLISFTWKSENDLTNNSLEFSYENDLLNDSFSNSYNSNYNDNIDDEESIQILPVININNLIPSITCETLKNIIDKTMPLTQRMILIDCRFPYEYNAGHIDGSINAYTCQKLLQCLFNLTSTDNNKKMPDYDGFDLSKLSRDDTIYVFYCEFSSLRGPNLAYCLRGLDRLANKSNRNLFIPNLFILQNGYREFHQKYSEYCLPNNYVSMNQVTYNLRNRINTEDMGMIDNDKQICTNKFRKEQKLCENEMRNANRHLIQIISKQTNDEDILKLFSLNRNINLTN